MSINIGGKAINCNINDTNGVTQVMTTSDGVTTTIINKKANKKTDNSKPTFSGMNISVGGANVTQVIVSSDD